MHLFSDYVFCELCDPKGWFLPQRIFLRAYVRNIYVRKVNRGNPWTVARKRKSWNSLNFTFNLNTLYLASILFTCVNVRSKKRVSGNEPQS